MFHKSDYDTQFKRGKKAYWMGFPKTKNPNRSGTTLAIIWEEGWDRAAHEDKVNPKIGEKMKNKYRK